MTMSRRLPALCLACAVLPLLARAADAPAPSGNAHTGDAAVVALVDRTAAGLGKDAAAALAGINAGDPACVAKDGPQVLVLDPEARVVASPDPKLQGRNLKGRPDPSGRRPHDEIVAKALAEGAGWVEHAVSRPGSAEPGRRKVRCRLAAGSDGRRYVVCAWMDS